MAKTTSPSIQTITPSQNTFISPRKPYIVFQQDTLHPVNLAWYSDASAATWLARGTNENVINADIFPNTIEANDSIVFAGDYGRSNPSTCGKFRGLNLQIDTGIAGTDVVGVWEYAKCNITTPSLANPVWTALADVVDNTNGLTTTGNNTVSWTIPTDWSNYVGNPASTVYYKFFVRYRITSFTTFTEGGRFHATSKPYIMDNCITVYGQNALNPLTMTMLYNADVAGGWGVITKGGSNQYKVDCSIVCYDAWVGTVFTSKREQIEFTTNNYWSFMGKVTLGEIQTGSLCKNGTSMILNGTNMDYSCCTIGEAGSSILNSQIRIIQSTSNGGYNGIWGGNIGARANQTLYDTYMEGWRHNDYSFPEFAVIGAKMYGGHIETPGGIVQNVTNYGGSYSIRPTSGSGYYIHQCDMSGAVSSCINPYQSTAVANFTFYAVDCNWGVFTDASKVRWNHGPTVTDQNAKIYMTTSMLIKVVDEQNNGISGATAVLKDKDGTVVWTYTTNSDGYIGADSGTITAAVAGSFTDSAKAWTINQYRWKEILITAGTGINQRRIVNYGGTATLLPVVPSFAPTPAANDRYVVIPYVNVAYFQPQTWGVNTAPYSTKTDLNPFTLKISKAGYKTYQSKFTLSGGLTAQITLSKVKDINFSNNIRIHTQ